MKVEIMTIQKENQDEAREKVALRIRDTAKTTITTQQATVGVYKKRPLDEDDLDPGDAPNADTVKLFEITSEARAEGFVETARDILADKKELDLKLAESHSNINNLLDNLNVKEF
ncbi:hypothetical protein [Alkalimarinus coralli]|uniref:hypothetical protein n=1 Tax=Alkalimarinus coralli TaxID=2935863 RepID=UPI00202B0F31|nr:hypothetical protein [Alkalimarinus coralli]